MTLYVKPRPWQQIAIEITHEENLDKAIELARELLASLDTKEHPKDTRNGSAKDATA